jgi:hypothetical protein
MHILEKMLSIYVKNQVKTKRYLTEDKVKKLRDGYECRYLVSKYGL